MTKYKNRLLVALISLIVLVLLGLGLMIGQLFKNYYLSNFNDRFKSEVRIVAGMIEKDGGLNTFHRDELDEIGEWLKTRITVVNREGAVQFDTGEDIGTTDNAHKKVMSDLVNDIEMNQRNSVGDYSFGTDIQYYWASISIDEEKSGYLFFATKLSELQQVHRQIWWILIVSLGLALFVIILLGSRITNRYTKPIESATNVAIELAKGNYRARTYEDHVDETGMLSASINILARNLQDLMKNQEMQQNRLSALIENMGSALILIDGRGYINLINKTYKENFNVEPNDYLYRLYHEVIEHKEVVAHIEEIFMTEEKTKRQVVLPIDIERRYFEIYGVPIFNTNHVLKGVLLVFHDITELKKLEQVRKDFVANVSHELKTPITSIKGFSETLLDGAINDKKALQSFLSIILKESDRLKSLIDDLLELSRIEKQGFKLNLMKVNINEQISEALTILESEADEKNIALHFQEGSGETVITGDEDKLKQVFINLISNAINYTPNDGTVSIEVIDENEDVVILVKDTGIGMEKKEVSRIFERFYRVDRARSRNSGGTGLGLAIVKHIIEAHQGKVEVHSELGKGSIFKLTFSKELPENENI